MGKKFLGLNGKEQEVAQSDIAVLLIDMQKDFVRHLRSGEGERIIPNQLLVLKQCAQLNIPVILIEFRRHEDTVDEIKTALEDVPSVFFLRKSWDNAFSNSKLEELLEEMGAHTLVLMGINADFCVMDTAENAVRRGYQIVTSNEVISGQRHHSRDNSRRWYQSNGLWVDNACGLIPNIA